MNLNVGSVHVPTLLAAVIVILGVLALVGIASGFLKKASR